MTELKFYDKDFNHICTLYKAISVVWNLKYRGFGSFEAHFSVNQDIGQLIKNYKFLIVCEKDRQAIITSKEINGEEINYPETDRFYGEVDNYTPTENGSLTIDLKRTAFGLKYEVSGVTDGTISVKIANSSRTFFKNTAITSEYESEEKIFTFYDVYSAWLYADNYTESITVSASWARGVGITQDLGSKTVQIKRNAMNVIRLKLGSVDYDGNIGIEVEEETDMDEETVIGTLE